MADSSSDLTALIARADRTLLIMENVVTEPLPLEVSDLLKAMTGLVRDLRDALTAAEARIRDLHDACRQKQEIIDSHAVVVAAMEARGRAVEQERDQMKDWADKWEEKAKALARQLSIQEERTGEWHRACDAAEQARDFNAEKAVDLANRYMDVLKEKEAAEQALAALRGTGPR